MFRLRHSSVSGFPLQCLSVRIPCTATVSPLFPPDVQLSRIRRTNECSAISLRK